MNGKPSSQKADTLTVREIWVRSTPLSGCHSHELLARDSKEPKHGITPGSFTGILGGGSSKTWGSQVDVSCFRSILSSKLVCPPPYHRSETSTNHVATLRICETGKLYPNIKSSQSTEGEGEIFYVFFSTKYIFKGSVFEVDFDSTSFTRNFASRKTLSLATLRDEVTVTACRVLFLVS